MKKRNLPAVMANFALSFISVALIGSFASLVTPANAQTPPSSQAATVNLPAGVQDVVTLARSGISEDPILAKVKSAGTTYNLTTEQIIYLHDQGVSENVIAALISATPPASTQDPAVAASAGSAPALPADTPPPLPDDSPAAPVSPISEVTPAQPVAQPGLNDGLLAYYPLNGDANDASGNSRNGWLVNSPSFVAGLSGRAIYLQSGKNQHVQLPHIQLTDYPGFSISLWAKMVSGWAGGDATMISFGTAGNAISIGCGIGNFNPTTNNNLYYTAGNGTVTVSPIPAECWNKWVHYSLVYDNGTLVAYLNGHAVNQRTGVIANQEGITAGLGIYWDPNEVSHFGGLINEVRVYKRALSAAEVGQLADASRLPHPPPIVGTTPVVPAQAEPNATPTAAPAQPEINFTYFHDQLAPYGQWVEVPGYGTCWYPARVIEANPDWRPYYDMGHWTYTENGWFWASDYNWGDIPFHYGRWIATPQYRWLWVPDYTWGPAWVAWRHAEADGCIGWAPLPFGAVWIDGGWRFHDRAVVDVGFDFGLGEDAFVFVGNDHFRDERFFRLRGRPNVFDIRRDRVHEFFGRSVIRNDFRRDEHGRLVNEGLGRERIEHLTGRRVEAERFEERHPTVRPEPARVDRPAPGIRPPPPERHPAPEVNKVYRPSAAPAPAKPSAPAKSSPPAKQANSNKKPTT
jgi:hypothetical protein